jgi:long-chain fatty acid transport protein
VRALRQEQPRWELYDNRNQRLYFAANLAIEPFDWLQIGGGLSFMAATRGRLDITGSANIFKPEQSQLRHEVDADLTAVRYPQIGARIAAGKRAAFALVYRGEFQLKLDIDANLNGDISSLTTALYQLRTSTVNAFLPQQLVLGGSFLATDDVRLNLDLTWMNWSAYIPPVADIDVVLDIPPPAGGWPPSIQPPTTPAPITMVPIRMKDTFVPHVGVEWRAVARPKWEILARGGYEWAQSPIPDQTGTTNYVDRDRHSFSIGAGLRLIAPGEVLPGDVRLDLHLQMHELVTRTTQKDDPADTVGDYTAGGRIWAFGSSLAVGF